MDKPPIRPRRGPLRTADAARESGYSPQQVRDLERLGVIPPATRSGNGYRCYTPTHLHALRAYRGLAAAVGPVAARRMLPELRTATLAQAASAVSALHVRLARERDEALHAQEALLAVRAEASGSACARQSDAMTITELAAALAVRPSTLRFWEQEGLLSPERVTSLRARRYELPAIRTARIIAALRGAGYGVPAVRDIVGSLHGPAGLEETRRLLGHRLDRIAARSVALLRAGSDLAAVVMAEREPPRA
ncbi:MerR family transcriptional regulator [Streptomyces pacificus]|uniref:MerR family transcriptional regulator n=1 Tax=Streptomyces pacificus TaxID=2705029 RepID=A0A6A0AQD3_9ACTN|nr:MerR family transcriptional regulator [Streptomyces pacificus]GFH34471.1 MerR family transcriptional regulator [Streptomyces pacificus]